jgi:8-oxo-dGTP diphosphatase
MKTITCIDIHGKKFDVPVNQLKWRPSVYGIVLKDESVLLSKQFDGYDLPGGGLDLGESPEAGVIREVKEETGVDVQNPKLVGLENSFFQSSHAEDASYQSLLLYFVCDFLGGQLSKEGFDEYEKQYADMAEWVPLNGVDKLNLASTVDYRPYIKKALSP